MSYWECHIDLRKVRQEKVKGIGRNYKFSLERVKFELFIKQPITFISTR